MKKIIIPILMLLLLIGVASSATVVLLDPQGILANNTYKDTSTVVPNFNVTGNSSTWNCYLYTNENGTSGVGTWRAVETLSSVANATNINTTTRNSIVEISGLHYYWDVFCNSSGDTIGDWGGVSNFSSLIGGYNYSVDLTNPSITVNYTSNGAWYNNNASVRIGLTIVDSNPAYCYLYSNLNLSANATSPYITGLYSNISTAKRESYTNNTPFNFTAINGSLMWGENNTGTYLWSTMCNDTAGRSTSLGSNYTFYVDISPPSAFDFNETLFRTDNRLLWNDTTATDYTPQIGWSLPIENCNFSRYEIWFYNWAFGNTTYVAKNVTNISQLWTSMSTLVGDTSYYINISGVDKAGNIRQMTSMVNNYKYSTDSTNRNLLAGWNIIGNVGNTFNLSNLLTWSGATTVSIWNITHEWVSHVSGGGSAGISVDGGEPVLLYLSSAINFSDLIWNTSAFVSGIVGNLSNQTLSDWNLLMNRNTTTSFNFQLLDNTLNNCTSAGTCLMSNITYFSAYNNSATTKYTPYVTNWSINNATSLSFGESIFMYFGHNAAIQEFIWGGMK